MTDWHGTQVKEGERGRRTVLNGENEREGERSAERETLSGWL